MLVMIFVNDLAGVKGLPWWNYHMPGSANGMTYVDMVFPAFLFIVGMAIPLAIGRRLEKGESLPSLWRHIVLRVLSLLVLGIALANVDKADERLMPVSSDAWGFLVLLGAILFWNVYPKGSRFGALFRVLRVLGFLLMVMMFVVFRRTTHQGNTAWLDFSYWEILGIIGWTYLATAILYVPTRRWKWAPLAWFLVACAFNVATTAKWLTFPDHLPSYVWPFSNGAFCLLTFAGMFTSQLILSDTVRQSLRAKVTSGLIYAMSLLLAGWLLSPLGISKIRATPTWCLYSAGASVLIFLALYWVCDVRKQTAWALPVKPAGSNTLLTYLLPDLCYFLLGSTALLAGGRQGASGVLKAVVFTACILLLSALLTRCKIRLQI